MKKIHQFLTSYIDLESTTLALFEELSFICNIFTCFLFEHVDSWSNNLLFSTHHLWNSTTELILNWTIGSDSLLLVKSSWIRIWVTNSITYLKIFDSIIIFFLNRKLQSYLKNCLKDLRRPYFSRRNIENKFNQNIRKRRNDKCLRSIFEFHTNFLWKIYPSYESNLVQLKSW